ncbi:unnamed protein product, partial [Hymenolepis diminuta]
GQQRTFYKDLQQPHRSIETSTDRQASVVGIDETSVRGALHPKAGLTVHAVFYMILSHCDIICK